MKIELLVVGKTGENYLKEALNEYIERLKHYIPFELIVIQDIKNAKNRTVEQLKEAEGDEILKHVKNKDYIVLLDEKGKEFSSVNFSNYLSKKMLAGTKRICFVIGGAYGFSEKVYKLSNDKIALSKMTFSHQLIRLIFVEQLYRAMTILEGQPYHHE